MDVTIKISVEVVNGIEVTVIEGLELLDAYQAGLDRLDELIKTHWAWQTPSVNTFG